MIHFRKVENEIITHGSLDPIPTPISTFSRYIALSESLRGSIGFAFAKVIKVFDSGTPNYTKLRTIPAIK